MREPYYYGNTVFLDDELFPLGEFYRTRAILKEAGVSILHDGQSGRIYLKTDTARVVILEIPQQVKMLLTKSVYMYKKLGYITLGDAAATLILKQGPEWVKVTVNAAIAAKQGKVVEDDPISATSVGEKI